VAFRVKNFDQLALVAQNLRGLLGSFQNKKEKPVFELHTWEQLSPFFNIVRMMNVMNMGIRVILISVVLISVLNVMMMSVYERVREIGTLAAMGTKPGRIMALFVAEGFSLGLVSALAGAAIGLATLWILTLTGVEVAFGGPNQIFRLEPSVSPMEVISACLIVLLVSVLASLQPAAKAARLAPVDALRHV
jgi:putative ABC transport system permease protein